MSTSQAKPARDLLAEGNHDNSEVRAVLTSDNPDQKIPEPTTESDDINPVIRQLEAMESSLAICLRDIETAGIERRAMLLELLYSGRYQNQGFEIRPIEACLPELLDQIQEKIAHSTPGKLAAFVATIGMGASGKTTGQEQLIHHLNQRLKKTTQATNGDNAKSDRWSTLPERLKSRVARNTQEKPADTIPQQLVSIDSTKLSKRERPPLIPMAKALQAIDQVICAICQTVPESTEVARLESAKKSLLAGRNGEFEDPTLTELEKILEAYNYFPFGNAVERIIDQTKIWQIEPYHPEEKFGASSIFEPTMTKLLAGETVIYPSWNDRGGDPNQFFRNASGEWQLVSGKYELTRTIDPTTQAIKLTLKTPTETVPIKLHQEIAFGSTKVVVHRADEIFDVSIDGTRNLLDIRDDPKLVVPDYLPDSTGTFDAREFLDNGVRGYKQSYKQDKPLSAYSKLFPDGILWAEGILVLPPNLAKREDIIRLAVVVSSQTRLDREANRAAARNGKEPDEESLNDINAQRASYRRIEEPSTYQQMKEALESGAVAVSNESEIELLMTLVLGERNLDEAPFQELREEMRANWKENVQALFFRGGEWITDRGDEMAIYSTNEKRRKIEARALTPDLEQYHQLSRRLGGLTPPVDRLELDKVQDQIPTPLKKIVGDQEVLLRRTSHPLSDHIDDQIYFGEDYLRVDPLRSRIDEGFSVLQQMLDRGVVPDQGTAHDFVQEFGFLAKEQGYEMVYTGMAISETPHDINSVDIDQWFPLPDAFVEIAANTSSGKEIVEYFRQKRQEYWDQVRQSQPVDAERKAPLEAEHPQPWVTDLLIRNQLRRFVKDKYIPMRTQELLADCQPQTALEWLYVFTDRIYAEGTAERQILEEWLFDSLNDATLIQDFNQTETVTSLIKGYEKKNSLTLSAHGRQRLAKAFLQFQNSNINTQHRAA